MYFCHRIKYKLYSLSRKSEVCPRVHGGQCPMPCASQCPMPNALCPMPYAHEYLIWELERLYFFLNKLCVIEYSLFNNHLRLKDGRVDTGPYLQIYLDTLFRRTIVKFIHADRLNHVLIWWLIIESYNEFILSKNVQSTAWTIFTDCHSSSRYSQTVPSWTLKPSRTIEPSGIKKQ